MADGSAPHTFDRLIDRIRHHARHHPDAPALSVLRGGQELWARYDYATLDRRARAIGAWLQRQSMQGERVVLLMEPGVAYASGLLGCLYAGAIAIPLPLPSGERQEAELQRTLTELSPRFILTKATGASAVEALAGDRQVVPVDTIDSALARDWRDPVTPASDLSLITRAFGQEGTPLYVQFTARNLHASLHQLQDAFALSGRSTLIPWADPIERLGLFGGVLAAFCAGAHAVWANADAYRARPLRFVRAASAFSATHLLAAHTDYAAAAKRSCAADRAALDLSSVRVALVGPQPVNPAALDAFSRAYQPAGFIDRAFTPWYGAPEAGMCMSGWADRHAPAVIDVDKDALEHHRVQLSEASAKTRRLMSVGQLNATQEILVVDPRSGVPVRAGEIGELWVRGPHVAAGYRDQRALSQYTFRAFRTDNGQGPYLRTGDLGFVIGGELFLVGSLSNALSLAGQVFHPLDVERSAIAADPVACGAAVAFSVSEGDEERLVVVIEAEGVDPAALKKAVRLSISAHHSLRVHDVVVVPPGATNRGPAGRLRRRAVRRAYLGDELLRLGEVSVANATQALQEQLGCALDLLPDQLSAHSSLRALGLSPDRAITISARLRDQLGVEVSPELLLADLTLGEVARQVL